MYFRFLIFFMLMVFVIAGVKPETISEEKLYTNKINVEVKDEHKTDIYTVKYGLTVKEFLDEYNLVSRNDLLNETYILEDHDVINLKYSDKKSINDISLEELVEIPYISETNAISIIEYRKINGNFKSIDEASNIKGIGDSKLKILKEYLSI